MSTKIECYCGLMCSDCSYRESTGCKGCIASEGHPFYGGECEIALCCKSRGIRFCGECADFPCEVLKRFSYDAQQGDNGARIEQCSKQKTALVAEAREGVDSVSVCGHHCDYCFMGQWCGGCRSSYNCCSYATISENHVCPNVACATSRGYDGCYDCPELISCDKGYYSNTNEYVAKATAIFIHKYGKETYTKVLKAAIADGVEYAKSFDETGSVDAALQLLERYHKYTICQ